MFVARKVKRWIRKFFVALSPRSLTLYDDCKMSFLWPQNYNNKQPPFATKAMTKSTSGFVYINKSHAIETKSCVTRDICRRYFEGSTTPTKTKKTLWKSMDTKSFLVIKNSSNAIINSFIVNFSQLFYTAATFHAFDILWHSKKAIDIKVKVENTQKKLSN